MRFQNTISYQDYLAIGWVKAPHHLQGALFIQLFNSDVDWAGNIKTLYISKPDQTLEEKKITKIRPHKNGFIILLEGIKDRTQAESYKGRQVNLLKSDITETESENYYLFEILDYQLHDQDNKNFGRVTGFKDNSLQDLLVITKEDSKTFDIPYVDELILNIDHDNKVVKMQIPPGIDEL